MYEYEITVLWMDGKQETYPCADYRVVNEVLHLNQRMHDSEPARAFPLGNVRTYTVTHR